MHAKPDLRVFLEWKIAGSGSVIAAVITLNRVLLAKGKLMAKWRVRMRVGLKNDAGSKLSNKLKPELKAAGMESLPNGSWQGDGLDSTAAADALKSMLGYLADPSSTTPADADAALTNLWLHIEHDA